MDPISSFSILQSDFAHADRGFFGLMSFFDALLSPLRKKKLQSGNSDGKCFVLMKTDRFVCAPGEYFTFPRKDFLRSYSIAGESMSVTVLVNNKTILTVSKLGVSHDVWM